MMESKLHISVLPQESIEGLNIKKDGIYIDCTLGEAGHSQMVLNLLDKNGKLISIDQDQNAIDFVYDKFSEVVKDPRWIIVRSNFSKLKAISNKEGIAGKVDGILMDLGLSSRQLEADERGFSYHNLDEELDMRMDDQLGVKAKDLLNALTEQELTKLLRKYGEERYASRIARSIKDNPTPISTVGELTSLVDRAVPAASRTQTQKHPSRRVFQALRIAVNDELNSLTAGIHDSVDILKPGGRLVIISFQSLEDRIVKNAFREFSSKGLGEEINRKPIIPSEEEIEENSRSHSAKLRIFELTAHNEIQKNSEEILH
jgi:16S rRNA (cytosine1402-N4)-methyltransferase